MAHSAISNTPAAFHGRPELSEQLTEEPRRTSVLRDRLLIQSMSGIEAAADAVTCAVIAVLATLLDGSRPL